jgi:CheY-like chemotaxis protein
MARSDLPVPRPRPFVLVIDDDSAFCVFLSMLIRSLGYEVMTTNSPEAAFLYELTENDVVFIDVMIPGMDGFQIMNTLSNQKTKCSIVLMSGSEDMLQRAEARAKRLPLKLLGILSKPFQRADVQRFLATH